MRNLDCLPTDTVYPSPLPRHSKAPFSIANRAISVLLWLRGTRCASHQDGSLHPPKPALKLAIIHFDDCRAAMRTGVGHRAMAQVRNQVFELGHRKRVICLHSMPA